MTPMQSLRDAHRLTRLVLVWFALFIGVAVASPLVNSQSEQMVCTAMGMKMVSTDDGTGDKAQPSSRMDCPLCAHVVALPLPLAVQLDVSSALAYALRPIPSAHIAWVTGSPLPPRGPPALS